ncbi:SAM-dependent methlyltransferase, partial [Devosia psychrophila]
TPVGTLIGYEIETRLAAAAMNYLVPFEGVTVIGGDATVEAIPPSDIIYVNAGVVAPPAGWLVALKPGGRMIFPWRPSEEIAMAVLATRTEQGITLRPCGAAYFIPCIGASSLDSCEKVPDRKEARSIRSLWRKADRAPDASALAIYSEVWFSSEEIVAA